MDKSILLNQHWVYMFALQILLAMMLVSTNLETVCANAVTPEIPTVSDNENEYMLLQDEKDEYADSYSPWSKRLARDDDLNADVLPVMVFFTSPAIMEELSNNDSGEINEDSIFNQKRGWKKMNVAWGKRRNAGQYYNRDFAPSASATNSWGKREPNWNNLKGMWGKRAAGLSSKRATSKGAQWNYLKTSWGKRSQQFPENN